MVVQRVSKLKKMTNCQCYLFSIGTERSPTCANDANPLSMIQSELAMQGYRALTLVCELGVIITKYYMVGTVLNGPSFNDVEG